MHKFLKLFAFEISRAVVCKKPHRLHKSLENQFLIPFRVSQPRDHRFWLDDHQHRPPTAPKAQKPDPQHAIHSLQTEAMIATGSLEN
jgi:hypothetical protein